MECRRKAIIVVSLGLPRSIRQARNSEKTVLLESDTGRCPRPLPCECAIEQVARVPVAIAHNKVMVIDSRIVITGSFNFTKAAEESNAENLLIIEDVDLAAKYAKNWQEHLDHSVLYERPAKE
jgi:phosphatidylserine/phosphatidylglycerophosphate/cardiolipin synthase-like enzyme